MRKRQRAWMKNNTENDRELSNVFKIYSDISFKSKNIIYFQLLLFFPYKFLTNNFEEKKIGKY
jgi:hypothetical protein